MTADTNGNANLALLIDADNISPKHVEALTTEIAKLGTASVRRIYGDWTATKMNSWKLCLFSHSIIPIQQFAYRSGKNATDSAMIIDAMDLLYTDRFSGFCIVSSDSDFTRLAARIREQGVAVCGFGERQTHGAFVAACDRFMYFDALSVAEGDRTARYGADSQPDLSDRQYAGLGKRRLSSPDDAERRVRDSPPGHIAGSSVLSRQAPPPQRLDEEALNAVAFAISNCRREEGDWVHLADVGGHLSRMSSVQAQHYGYHRLRDFVMASGIVEWKVQNNGHPMVRLEVAS